MCNRAIQGKGEAKVVKVSGLDTCRPTVVMEHEGGCKLYSMLGFAEFMANNAWFSGTVLLVIGVIMILAGRKFFQWIIAAFSFIFVFTSTLIFASILDWF